MKSTKNISTQSTVDKVNTLPLKKVFLQPLFGKPYDWTQQYLDNIAQVEGYDWKIFTPHALKPSGKNTEIINMHIGTFDKLVEEACGLNPDNYIDGEAPHKNLTDFYPAYGDIFKDYIKGYDYWGHTNWDCVYGRLGHFLPDSVLAECDIWADESNSVNGTFSLYRNDEKINKLYQKVDGWKEAFTLPKLFGFDEMDFSVYAVKEGYVTNPIHYPFHSYDRFPLHIREPQLEYKDGRLYEVFEDAVTLRKIGKELMWFHFSYSKRWPL